MKLFTPLLVITLLGLATVPRGHAQENAADSNAVQANLKQMEDAWVKALVNKDQAAVGNVIADDFAGFNPDGKHVGKSQLLDEMKNERQHGCSCLRVEPGHRLRHDDGEGEGQGW